MDIKQILDDVANSLNDPEFIRWTESELVSYLNDGCLILCRANPTINAKTATIKLQNGALQTAGSDSLALLTLHRCINTGRALRQIDPRLLNTVLPMWQSKTHSDDVREFIIDGVVKNRFWVYPPAIGNAVVEGTVSKKPEVVTLSNNGVYPQFPLQDENVGAIKAYMLSRAYAIDTGAGSLQKSQLFQSNFLAAMGMPQGNQNERNKS